MKRTPIKRKKKKAKTLAQEVEAAAKFLQKLRRLEEADEYGMVVCVITGKRRKWNDRMDGGHFISRGRLSTKLVEWNIHPQSKGSNRYSTSFTGVQYRNYMVSRYGEDKVAWLEREAGKTRKYTRGEIEILVLDYKRRIKALENSFLD